jgi:hypothetical protein
MKNIRIGVFETNSSSSHSLTVSSGELQKSTLSHQDGVIVGLLGDFGWEIEYYDSQSDKLSYLLTQIQYNDHLTELAKAAISEYTGLKMVVAGKGYVDHQSSDTLDELLCGSDEEIKQNMINFVFNSGYSFDTDNDNH